MKNTTEKKKKCLLHVVILFAYYTRFHTTIQTKNEKNKYIRQKKTKSKLTHLQIISYCAHFLPFSSQKIKKMHIQSHLQTHLQTDM